MCGIAGIYNPHGIPNHLRDKDRIKGMTSLLHHRGPDEKGILTSEIAHLGHARLNIIDLSTGSQPMCSVDKQIAIVFNGEIFNYIELREELILKNHVFQTTSDTETIIMLYREYGTEMLGKLNGQFAFVLIDFKNRRLFAARDRVGIRPFYYTFLGDTFIFASSIKAITKNPEVEREFNYSAFQELINLWTTYGDSTIVKNIFSLSPGESFVYDRQNKQKKTYWDLKFPSESSPSFTFDQWKEKIHSELAQSTTLRLRADVPVKTYLSGGLDSSIILKLVQKHHPVNLESFSVSFADQFFDESKYQVLMNENTGVENYCIEVTPEMIGNAFEDVIFHCEQPIFRTAPMPLYYLSRLVNEKGCKVVLTGEGADEVAWGYNIFKETLIRSRLSKDPNNKKWLNRLCELNAHLPQYSKRYEKFLIDFYKNSLNDVDSPFFSHKIRMGNGQYVLNFLQEETKNQVQSSNWQEEIGSLLPKEFSQWNPLQKTQYLEMKTLLAGYLLSSQGDRMSMSHSVEGRYPFLDHNVIEAFAQVPDEFKLNGMKEKHLLKETFRSIIPDKIIQRPKYPYRAPEGISLLQPAIEERYLNETTIVKSDFFDWKYVQRLMSKIQSSKNTSAFVDNATLVIITSTLIFLEHLKTNFGNHDNVDNKVEFNEIVI